jgi:hypothetical protein
MALAVRGTQRQDGQHEETRGPTQVMPNQMQGEIAALNNELDQTDDPREGYAKVQAKIRKFRQAGQKVPDDLVLIERRLMHECMLASQGRD